MVRESPSTDWWLHFLNPIQSKHLNSNQFLLGRGRDSEILIRNPNISRRHCLIERSQDGYSIRCLGSTNGTFINNQQIEPEVETPLKEGDVISFCDLNSVNILQHTHMVSVVTEKSSLPVQRIRLILNTIAFKNPQSIKQALALIFAPPSSPVLVDLVDISSDDESAIEEITVRVPSLHSNSSDVAAGSSSSLTNGSSVDKVSHLPLDKSCEVRLHRLDPKICDSVVRSASRQFKALDFVLPDLYSLKEERWSEARRKFLGRKVDIYVDGSDDDIPEDGLDSPEYDITYSQADDIITLDDDEEFFISNDLPLLSIKKEASIEEVYLSSDDDHHDLPAEAPKVFDEETKFSDGEDEEGRFFPVLSQDFSSDEEKAENKCLPTPKRSKSEPTKSKRRAAEFIDALPMKSRKRISDVDAVTAGIKDTVISVPMPSKPPAKKSKLRKELAKKYNVHSSGKQGDVKAATSKPKIPAPAPKMNKAVIKNSSRSRNDFLVEAMIAPVPKPVRKAKLVDPLPFKKIPIPTRQTIVPVPSVSNAIAVPNAAKAKKSVTFTGCIPERENSAFNLLVRKSGGMTRRPTERTVLVKPIVHKDLIIFEMCSWNPLWIKEQERQRTPTPPPGVIEGLRLIPAFNSYVTFNDYFNVYHPMFLNEVWEKVREDFSSNREWRMLKKHRITFLNVSEAQISENKFLTCLEGTVDVTGNGTYFQRGDLGIMEVTFTYARGQLAGKPVPCKCFAIVKNAYVLRNNGGVNNKWKIDISFKKRTHGSLDATKNITITCISYVGPEIRLFRSLVNLPNSCLANAILTLDPRMFILKSNSKPNDCFEELNETQSQISYALVNACKTEPNSPQIAVIQGPPGTGKSFFIIHTIIKLIYGHTHKHPMRILLAAPSNAAVDHLVKMLAQKRVQLKSNNSIKPFKMVRIGQEAQVDPAVLNIFLDSLVSRNMKLARDQETDLENLKLDISEVEASINSLTHKYEHLDASKAEAKAEVGQLITLKRSKLEELRKKLINPSNTKLSKEELKKRETDMRTNILAKANIVASTIGSCLSGPISSFMKTGDPNWRRHFDVCIVDEAGQCVELDTLIVLQFDAPKLFLVGDHKQLAPMVKSKIANDRGYARSFFERAFGELSNRPNINLPVLDLQYRMHPEIASWPSEYFYNSIVKSDPNMAARRSSFLRPYLVLDVKGKEVEVTRGNITNPIEADLVVRLITLIVARYCDQEFSIGVITPYANQRDEIKSRLGGNFKQVEVNTVDGFQGREKDIVIMSCVRAHSSIGFLNSHQRLNVAVTRAKYSFIVVCHVTFLMRRSLLWSDLLNNAKKRNCIIPIEEDPAKNTLSEIFL